MKYGYLFLLVFLGACGSAKKAYLFTSFREPATDGLYFLGSEDGTHWTDLGGSWLKPEIGEKKLMRDPSMAQGPDGVWHLVWTSGWNGDKGFGYASSTDLIHWSPQEFVPVMAGEADAFNVWAPEIFYEKDSAQFIIVWATTIPFRFPKGIEDEKNNHRLYCTTTKDFKTFAPTRLFFDPGYSVIDAMIVQRGAHDFVLVFKDNTRNQRNIKVAFSDRASGPYHNDSKAFTPEFTEGPSVAQVGKTYYIYFDSYREKKYGAVRTTDFKTFTGAEVSVPVGHKHGTVVRVDRKTLERLNKNAKK
ncbi:MAG: glycoside hydrolase family 43 protein [Bacteroidetes bacterium]|nr:glycoside hydrolase family 43 protein [Bacteroidota bacterium]